MNTHLAWQNTKASEDGDGLGSQTPFPLIGDNAHRLCQSLGVLDEVSGMSQHALVVLNPQGDLVYKDVLGEGARVNLPNVIEMLKKTRNDNTIQEEEEEEDEEEAEGDRRMPIPVVTVEITPHSDSEDEKSDDGTSHAKKEEEKVEEEMALDEEERTEMEAKAMV